MHEFCVFLLTCQVQILCYLKLTKSLYTGHILKTSFLPFWGHFSWLGVCSLLMKHATVPFSEKLSFSGLSVLSFAGNCSFLSWTKGKSETLPSSDNILAVNTARASCSNQTHTNQNRLAEPWLTLTNAFSNRNEIKGTRRETNMRSIPAQIVVHVSVTCHSLCNLWPA